MPDMKDVSRDAAAIVAAMHKGDYDSAQLLAGFYDSDLESASLLCGALSAFACALLQSIDGIRDEIATTTGVIIPSSRDVLSSVLVRLADVD